jgi:hypothetical protein
MKGGSLMRVTSSPLSRPKGGGGANAAQDGQRRGQAQVGRQLGHHDAAQRHDHAAAQVDAGGEDDQRLADGDDAHHHHLLQDEREVLAAEELVGRGAEDHAGDQQRDERPELAQRRQFVFQGGHAGPLGWWGGGRLAPSWPHGGRAGSQGLAGLRLTLPQHRSVPVFTSLLSTPATALAAIRVTPVSV